MRWCKGKTLQFIALVRSHSILWDPNNVQRYNKLLKNAAWESIADKMENTDMSTCKRKWESIQASFRREKSCIKRNSVGKGPDQQHQSRWYAYNSLKFMLDRRTANHTHSCTIASNTEPVEMQTSSEPSREQKVILNNSVPSPTVEGDADYKQLQMETDIIIDCWTVKYCKLPRDQRFYADQIAIDVLYEGEIGRLSRACAIFKSVTSKSAIIEQQQSAQSSTNTSFNSGEVSISFESFANTNQSGIEAESTIVVKNWAVKYSRLARDQRLLAEKIINDVLFQGAFGSLTLESTMFSATLASASNESTRVPISTNGSHLPQTGQSQYTQHDVSDLHEITSNTEVNLTSNAPEVLNTFPCLVDISEISPTFLKYFEDELHG